MPCVDDKRIVPVSVGGLRHDIPVLLREYRRIQCKRLRLARIVYLTRAGCARVAAPSLRFPHGWFRSGWLPQGRLFRTPSTLRSRTVVGPR